jgi:hypothetical protein
MIRLSGRSMMQPKTNIMMPPTTPNPFLVMTSAAPDRNGTATNNPAMISKIVSMMSPVS